MALCFSQLFSFTLCHAAVAKKPAPPSQTNPQVCGRAPHPMRTGLRYTTPKGIGYKTGYSTLEGFFAPQAFLKDAWVPFLDVRGHVFDNGKLAANTGLGVRYLTKSRVWGINGYYDYRNTSHQHYNQVAAGLESLGRIWDFRINGYLPVGKKQSGFSSSKFSKFQGHHLLIRRTRHFCMKGANAEAGFHLDHFKNAPLYFAAGPYYLTGVGKTAWGGELRARVDLLHDYLRVEANTSYDHFFKWIGQAQVSVNIPFGGRKKVTTKAGSSCSQAMALHRRALQSVDRNEIIPEGKQRAISPAINPDTGKPWYFWFVDNTSASKGTYESPYPTLLAAQNASQPNQVIYVFPGDGTTTGMANGITLQDGQMFLGASTWHPIPTTQGIVIIPSLASTVPIISNTNGDSVTLMNDNTVSGFEIMANNGNGLSGTNVHNLVAYENTFVTNVSDTNGIYLFNPSGEVVIGSDTFTDFVDLNTFFYGNGLYLQLDAGNTLDNLTVIGSMFDNIEDLGFSGGSGIRLNLFGGRINHLHVSDTTFTSISEFGAGIFTSVANGAVITDFTVSTSKFENFSGIASGINTALSGTGTITDFTVSNNTFIGFSDSQGFNIQSTGSSTISNFNISNNNFKYFSGGSRGFNTQLFNTAAITQLNVSGNIFFGIYDTSQGFVYANGASSNNAVALSNNTFTGNGSASNGYAANISTSAANLCLAFTNNNAVPITAPIPYAFTQTGGTFNRTLGSDSSQNTGQFLLTGAVNAPGSCSQ